MEYNQLDESSLPESKLSPYEQHSQKEDEAKQQHPPPSYSQQPMLTQPQVYPPGTIVVPQSALLPKEKQPNDYIVLTVLVAIGCGVLNITSLFFSIPAVICSFMAYERRNNGEYGLARKLGYIALGLSLLCVTWVMIGAVIAVGILVECVYADLCNFNYNDRYRNY